MGTVPRIFDGADVRDPAPRRAVFTVAAAARAAARLPHGPRRYQHPSSPGGAVTTVAAATLEPIIEVLPRELAHRRNGALDIFLLWQPGEDAVTVVVEDLRTGVRIEMAVDPRDALAAFHHPFAYAP
jgi:hypothetical protein